MLAGRVVVTATMRTSITTCAHGDLCAQEPWISTAVQDHENDLAKLSYQWKKPQLFRDL